MARSATHDATVPAPLPFPSPKGRRNMARLRTHDANGRFRAAWIPTRRFGASATRTAWSLSNLPTTGPGAACRRMPFGASAAAGSGGAARTT
jgi:hypothetical protein